MEKMQKQCYIGIAIIFLSGLAGFGYGKIKKMRQQKEKSKQFIKNIEAKDIEHIKNMEDSDLKVEM